MNRCAEEVEREKQKQAALRAKMQDEKVTMERLKADQQRDKQNKLTKQMVEEAEYI